MSIKASASVTLSSYRDTEAVTRYYKLVSSTASAPSKPTTNPPSGWDDTEPSYTSGSTNTLYFCDLTEFSDGTWAYSAVSKSSSYEAAKEAYNKAQNAQDTANSANGKIDDLDIGGRNLFLGTKDFSGSKWSSSTNNKYYNDGDIKYSKLYSSPSSAWTTYIRQSVPLDADTEYILSALMRKNTDEDINVVWRYDATEIDNNFITITSKEWTRVVFPCKKRIGAADSEPIILFVPANSTCVSAETAIDVAYIKFEKGNKATDWTPAPEDVDAAINAKISSVDVEYYLSTSSTSLSGGSWQTTAPTWVDGKYMWSRTKITDGVGKVTYSPSQNGTCIAGAKGSTGATGATGTGISSITEEYYLSTSKTSQTGGEWSTTPPTWSSGKYIWTRSKIVYTNPSSTVYTTPVCDSSWEAVNEIEVGGRNLLRNTGNITKWIKESGISVTPDSDGWYKITADSSLTSSHWGIYQDFSGYEQNTDYTVSLYLKNGSNAGKLSIGYGGWGQIVITGSSTETKYSYTFNTGSNTAVLRIYICLWATATGENFYVKLPKLEKGNKATDWTPAPEDMVDKANIVSCINQTPESITIQANKISLEGLITANSNFKILNDGSMETIAGNIGGWSIGNNKIYSENQLNVSLNNKVGTSYVSLVSDNSNNDEVISVVYDYLEDGVADDRTPGTDYVKIFNDGRLKLGSEGIWADDTPSIYTTEIKGSSITLTGSDQEAFKCLITEQDIQFVSSVGGDAISLMAFIGSRYETIVNVSDSYHHIVLKANSQLRRCYFMYYRKIAVPNNTVVYTIPSGYRPIANGNVCFNLCKHASSGMGTAQLSFGTDGKCVLGSIQYNESLYGGPFIFYYAY